jgi:hypothetical protein
MESTKTKTETETSSEITRGHEAILLHALAWLAGWQPPQPGRVFTTELLLPVSLELNRTSSLARWLTPALLELGLIEFRGISDWNFTPLAAKVLEALGERGWLSQASASSSYRLTPKGVDAVETMVAFMDHQPVR